MKTISTTAFNPLRCAKCACLLLLLFSFDALYAQTDTTKKLKQVDITAARAELLKSIAPAQQIKADQFIRYSAFNVADAIRGFAGVNIKDYGGVGGLKTISVRGLGANHTAVLLNGVQLNDAQNGQIDLSKLNLYNVAEIDLYNAQPDKLPQPARSFAAASVLSIATIRPQLSPQKPYQVSAAINSGSFGLVNPYLQWQQRLSSRWSFIADANFLHATGKYKYRVEGDRSDTLAARRNGGIRSTQTNAAIYWAKSDSNNLGIVFNYYGSQRGLPGAVIFYNPYNGQYIDNNDAFAQLSYWRIWRGGLQLLLNTKGSQLKTHYLDPNFLNQQGFLEQRYNQQEIYQSIALAYHITPSLEVSYSADGSIIKMDADLFNYAYPARRTLLNVIAAAYTKGIFQLQGSLLQSNISESVKTGQSPPSRSVLSPTFIASARLNSNIQLRAFYKQIFRAPTLDEVYFYAISNPRTIKPEVARQFNTGVTWTKNLDNTLQYFIVSADAYYNTVKDKILAVPGKNPAIFIFSNISRVEIKGIDVGIKTQTQPNKGLSSQLSVNYSYQQAIDVSDKALPTYGGQLPYTPRHTLSVNAGLNFQKTGIYLNYLLSSSRYYAANNVPQYRMPGYAIFDLSGTRQLVVSKIPVQASVEVNNLLNKNYSVIRNYPMPGRSVRLTLQITI